MKRLGIALVVMSLSVSFSIVNSVYCPDRTATFTTFIEQLVDTDDPAGDLTAADPELTFLREVLGFRDNDIQHVLDDAVNFFNETYGLDFSLSPPNDQGELFFENAIMAPFRFRENSNYSLFLNNWIQTGSTRFTCKSVLEGGYNVIFTGDQLLRGSYGGKDGIGINAQGSLLYGFSKIYTCDQSPVIIQIQSATPFRLETIDQTFFVNFDAYNTVLGRGRGIGSSIVKPAPKNPGKSRFISRIVYTFPDE